MTRSAIVSSKRFRVDRSARRIGRLVGLACLMGTLALPGLTPAQVGAGADIPALQVHQTREFELSTGFEHRFKTDIDNGGEVQESRLPIRLGYSADLSQQWRLGLGLTYVYNRFDFSGTTGFGGLDPWEHIHLFDINFPVTYRLSSAWSLSVIPFISIHAESGADASEGIEGGGFVVALYQFSPRFSLGLVVGAQSQIEDDAAFFILPLIYWQISSQLWLTSKDDPLRGRYGAELTYRFGGGWRVGVGWGSDPPSNGQMLPEDWRPTRPNASRHIPRSRSERNPERGCATPGSTTGGCGCCWATVLSILDDRALGMSDPMIPGGNH